VTRGYLGVSTENVTPDVAEQLGLPKDTKGVVISDIVPNSAADKAGLKRTDVLLGVNGHPIASLEEMRLMIAQMAPGSVVKLRVVRDAKEITVNVTLDKFAEKPNELMTGVTVKPLNTEDRRRLRLDPRVTGLLVTEISDDSPHRDRLAVDAVIMEINRTPVREVEEARQLLQPGRNLLAVYYRGAARFVVITQK